MVELGKGSLQHLQDLNEEQLKAVQHVDGPLLVLAGAGTGKTRVLTARVANLIATESAMPWEVLAVTFTNKASREMKARIGQYIGHAADNMNIGTFHSISAKILRKHADILGFTNDFTIIDHADQLKLVKKILEEANLKGKEYPAKLLLYFINRFKDRAVSYDKVPESEGSDFSGKLIELYSAYQQHLKFVNAMDFGDLILNVITLFNSNLDLCKYYQEKFKFVLVDEYQDTNIAQYLWLRILVQNNNNICCVGDDDQSIYGWRGAEVTNILRFEHDFASAKVIRLEKNYRSTKHILDIASGLIANNKARHGKVLWTDLEEGNKIKLNNYYDDKEEARLIAEEIDALNRLHGHVLSEMAILVRAGYQTRNFEESLNFLRIPYKIVGGAKFYEKAEIKDAIAYIRVLVNKDDSLAFERIINVPKRGIGPGTLQKIVIESQGQQISLYDAANLLIENGELKSKAALTLGNFLNQFTKWREQLTTLNHSEVVDLMLNESGYLDIWKLSNLEENKDRLDNIKELIQSLSEYESLIDFLEHISLISDNDEIDDYNKVNIMTMHAAKGLEFQTIFLPGWEEGIFPSSRSVEENSIKGIEEERRLAYVAITRAKRNLYISYVCYRRLYSGYQQSWQSRFIEELPKGNYELISNYNKTYVSSKSVESQNAKYIEDKKKYGFCVGEKVTHKNFGEGVIIKVEDDVMHVFFNSSGLKKIMYQYLVKT